MKHTYPPRFRKFFQNPLRKQLFFLFFFLLLAAGVKGQDTTPPVFDSPPEDATYECFDDVPAPGSLMWTDDFDGSGFVLGVDVSDNYSCPETITRTWSYTDKGGNTASVSQIIIVDDTTNPTASNPAPISVQCPGNVPAPNIAVVTDETDNCTASPVVAFVSDVSDGNTCPEIITRTYSITDACGNSINVTQTITVDDTNPPVFDTPPSAASYQCISEVPAPGNLSWTDNCDGSGQVLGVDVSDGASCPETITRTWSYTDACGNEASVSQIITVDDTTPPVFATPPSAASYQCLSEVPAPGYLSWTDNCDGSGQVLGVDVSDGLNCPETITRTWTYTDACGNPASVSQIITVDDNTAPVFAAAPADATYECIGDVPAPGMLTWTDNCDGSGEVLGVDVSDGLTCPETITRTWSYTDACSNPASVSQIITVWDDIAPQISGTIAPIDLTGCDVSPVPAPVSTVAALEGLGLVISDNCTADANLTVNSVDVSSGTCPIKVTRTYTVTDNCENGSSVDAVFWIYADPVALTVPGDYPGTTCMTQAEVNTDFSIWLEQAGFTGGCGGVLTNNAPAAPSFCGGQVSVTWTVNSSCEAPVSLTRTFTIPSAPAVSLTVPDNYTGTSCMTQADVNTAFETWLGQAGFTGGCGGVLTNNAPAPPSFCGGSVAVTWTVSSGCEGLVSLTRTFTIPSPAVISLTVPNNFTGTTCMSQDAVNAAYTAFVNGASFSGGCGGVLTNNAPAAPSFCGGQVSVTWTVNSSCEAPVSLTRTFTIPNAPAVNLTVPSNYVGTACMTQAEVNAAFTNWLGQAGFTGGCGGIMSTTPAAPVAPSYCGGSVTVTWKVSSNCNADVVKSATFFIPVASIILNLPPDRILTNPNSDEDIINGFYDWLESFSYSGGCNVTWSHDFHGDLNLIPGLCGGEITVTWTVNSSCSAPVSGSRTFSVLRNSFQTIADGTWQDQNNWKFGCVPSYSGGIKQNTVINFDNNIYLNNTFITGLQATKFEIYIGKNSSCFVNVALDFIVQRTVDIYINNESFFQVGTEAPEGFDYCGNDSLNYEKSLFHIQGSELTPSLNISSGSTFTLFGDFLVEENFVIKVAAGGIFNVFGEFVAGNSANVSFIGEGESNAIGVIECNMDFTNSGLVSMVGANLDIGGDLWFGNASDIYIVNSILTVDGAICSGEGDGGGAIITIHHEYYDFPKPRPAPPGDIVIIDAGEICSQIIIDDDIILPIELLSFNAEVLSESIDLLWTTGTEINNDYFTIERSRELTAWEVLGFVEGAGNSSIPLDYGFTDYRPLDGLAYYRLKQTDFDGKFKYYGPVAAHYDLGLDGLEFKVMKQYDHWIIAVPQDGIYQVEVYTLTGRRLVSKQVENTLTIPAPEGGVVIRVTDGFARSASRVVM